MLITLITRTRLITVLQTPIARAPGRSGLGLGDLLSGAGSPDGRPDMTKSQIL